MLTASSLGRFGSSQPKSDPYRHCDSHFQHAGVNKRHDECYSPDWSFKYHAFPEDWQGLVSYIFTVWNNPCI